MVLSQAYLEWEREVEQRGEQRGIAIGLLLAGTPPQEVAQLTGLSLAQVTQLQQQQQQSSSK